MALGLLHFLLYILQMSIVAQIVHFLRLYIAHMTVTVQFMIQFLDGCPFQSCKTYLSIFYGLSYM